MHQEYYPWLSHSEFIFSEKIFCRIQGRGDITQGKPSFYRTLYIVRKLHSFLRSVLIFMSYYLPDQFNCRVVFIPVSYLLPRGDNNIIRECCAARNKANIYNLGCVWYNIKDYSFISLISYFYLAIRLGRLNNIFTLVIRSNANGTV